MNTPPIGGPPNTDSHELLGSAAKPTSKLTKLVTKALTVLTPAKQLKGHVVAQPQETGINTPTPVSVTRKPLPPTPQKPPVFTDLLDFSHAPGKNTLKKPTTAVLANVCKLLDNLPVGSSNDLKEFLEIDIDNGKNILEIACERGHVNLVKAILAKADERTFEIITRKDSTQSNLLHKMAMCPTLADSDRFEILTAFHELAKNNQDELRKLFIDRNEQNKTYAQLLFDSPTTEALVKEIQKSPFFS
jgi:hypothetical protein